MQEQELFAAALGLQSPWYVSNLDFSLENKNNLTGKQKITVDDISKLNLKNIKSLSNTTQFPGNVYTT